MLEVSNSSDLILPYTDPYQALAVDLWNWQCQPLEKIPRTSRWLWTLQESGISLRDLFTYMMKPKEQVLEEKLLNAEQVGAFLVGPVLRKFRGDRTISEVIEILKVRNKETYHYWETGQRDLPLSQFLKVVDLIGGRLQIFCEMIGFKKDLREFRLKSFKENLSGTFFKKPWTPTVYLLLHTEAYRNLPEHQDAFLSKQIGISLLQVQDSLADLADLEMIRYDGKRYIPFKGVFYTPPNLNPEVLNQLNSYWMNKSFELMSCQGLHKIEQAAVSFESRDKIVKWVGELREKIREEIKTTQPETVLHMQWQVADLLTPEVSRP